MFDDETIIFLIVLGIAFVVFVIVLNPYFWQGFRNAKYWDELKDVGSDKDKHESSKHEDTGKDIKPWTDSTC